ncbi:C-type lectin domain family 10 member A-like [Platichthys flesus]|uniref:C-type lectin domain family 10 member A-like n=1 Tax=Platichthys flesus TaxID=8260 RepID=UPI002DBF6D97|nr:C-type lectin domain family 10 member A-like [Platichthys flesus]
MTCHLRMKEQDESVQWIDEPQPFPVSGVSRFRRWMVPALAVTVILVLILSLGVSYVTTSNGLRPLETRVSNLSNVIESLSSSLKNAQDVTTSNRLWSVEKTVSSLSNVIESLSTSLQNAQDVTTSNRLWSVEKTVSNLSNVIESLSTSLQNAQESADKAQMMHSAVEDRLTSGITRYVTTSNRLWSVEKTVSNLSNVIESLSTSLQNAQDVTTSNRLRSVEKTVSNLSNVIESLSTSLQNAQESADKAQMMHSAVEDRLTSGITRLLEALKQVLAIDSLSRSLTSNKCSLEQIINNSSGLDGCCPPDWKLSGLSCYFFSHSTLSWNDSRAWCETHESHLVILSSDRDWDFVTPHTHSEFFWVGLSDWRTGTWEWVDQTPYSMDSRQWRPGQPDNWDGHGLGPGGEDCAHLHRDGRLNDQHCSEQMRFICQKRSGDH